MPDRTNILIIGGRESMRKPLRKELLQMGYGVEGALDGTAALEELQTGDFQVVLLSSELVDLDGNKILRTIKDTHPSIEVIVIAERGTMRSAFDSMRLGAYDYLTGPFDSGEIVSTIQKAIGQSSKYPENGNRGWESPQRSSLSGIVGESLAIKSILNLVKKAGPTNSTVLIQGETGTGKELIANAVHVYSSRWNRPFIVVNCSAIPDTLLESELFGYEKGAFTDATRLKHGLLETANGGTLFLDEVSEISSGLQSKLLRAVETGEFRRLGSNQEIRVDLRIICATNRDLYREMASRHFREDLYYRLSVVTINVPPLRERPDDIPLLVNFFLHSLVVSGKGKKTISPEALEILKKYEWPGNIRELRNVIERLVILSERDTIEAMDLPPNIQKQKTANQAFLMQPAERCLTLEEMEKIYIEKILEQSHGHRSRAAKVLGISRHTLYNKLKHFGIDEKKIISFKASRKE